MGFSRPKKDFV